MDIVPFNAKPRCFYVYLKALKTKPIIIEAECYQLVYGSTIMFFDMSAKEVSKFRAAYGQPPACVASFSESDITAIVQKSKIKGEIPNDKLIKREIELAKIKSETDELEFPEGFVEVLGE